GERLRLRRTKVKRGHKLVRAVLVSSRGRGLNQSLVSATAVCVRVLRISPTRKRSVSRARRWLDAFRLSMSCELIDGCARTRSIAASQSCASPSQVEPKAEYFLAGFKF